MLTFTAFVLAAVFSLQSDPSRQAGELVDKLRSEHIEEREAAELTPPGSGGDRRQGLVA